jgi:hypothetical protein
LTVTADARRPPPSCSRLGRLNWGGQVFNRWLFNGVRRTDRAHGQWSPWALIGAPLILIGNVVIFLPKFGRGMVWSRFPQRQTTTTPEEQG